jgi:pimeloyl-ACP methyl ester carboxylesterase
VLVACAASSPLSVRPTDPGKKRRAQQVNALASDAPSDPTRIVLRRQDLALEFEQRPAEAIAQLHELVVRDEATSDTLFALAELSFLFAFQQLAAGQDARAPARPTAPRRPRVRVRSVAENAELRASGRAHYLAAAVYAWAFLFAEREPGEARLVDPRARLAADLYNHAVAAAFTGKGRKVELRAGVYALPFGVLEVDFDSAALEWGASRLTEFLPVADFEVRGLQNRYRQPGIGAPLLAHAVRTNSRPDPDGLGLTQGAVSTTALLRLEAPRAQLRGTNLKGRLELYRGREVTSLEFAGRRVPLETEPSAALAATLEFSGVWRDELSAFLGRALGVERPPRLFGLEPPTPGLIPVVFVHGTSSNPAVWANMVNDLQSHPSIRERFSFWFFAYDSGNPILYSGMRLRRTLREAVAQVGSPEADPCLGEMVVIGHSQGGLLTKLTAIDSGTRFWDNISRRPFDRARLRPKTRALLREAVFVEPLPFVKRVVFIATPHRGSFLASPRIVRRLASRLITLPSELLETSTDLAGLAESAPAELRRARIATSLDNMSPGNVFIRTLAEIPVVPAVSENSIVAVRGNGPPERGNDGVVRFSSAHSPDADSELIVRSGHSTQSNPHTINEVERILRRHAEDSTCLTPEG